MKPGNPREAEQGEERGSGFSTAAADGTGLVRRRFTAEDQRKLALAWRTSGMTQQEFCAGRGLSTRTLRNFLRRLPNPRWDRQLRSSVVAAVAALAEILKAMDSSAATKEGQGAAGTKVEVAGGDPVVHPTPATQPASALIGPPANGRPVKPRPSSVSRDPNYPLMCF